MIEEMPKYEDMSPRLKEIVDRVVAHNSPVYAEDIVKFVIDLESARKEGRDTHRKLHTATEELANLRFEDTERRINSLNNRFNMLRTYTTTGFVVIGILIICLAFL